jgi:hypothetical protein
MTETGSDPVVVKIRLTPMMAEKRIHELAEASENIIFGDDALDDMEARSITDIQVLEILLAGFVSAQPETTEHGDWRCKITKELRGRREAGAVVVILRNSRLFLQRVAWENRR